MSKVLVLGFLGLGCHWWRPRKLGFNPRGWTSDESWSRGLGFSLAGTGLSALVALIPCLAMAQQPVITYSKGTTSSNNSGTVTSGGVFQKIFDANIRRAGCAIQNNGTNTMYVTEGLGVAGSTTGKAVALSAGQMYNCQFGGIVLTGEIDLTSASAGDAYYAAQE